MRKCIVSLPSSINSLWIALRGFKKLAVDCVLWVLSRKPFTSPSQWEKPGVGRQEEAPQTGISLGAVNLGLLEGRQESLSAQRLDRKEVDVTGEVTDRHTNHIFGNRN